jgi:hypothetical protein
MTMRSPAVDCHQSTKASFEHGATTRLATISATLRRGSTPSAAGRSVTPGYLLGEHRGLGQGSIDVGRLPRKRWEAIRGLPPTRADSAR